MCAGLGHLYAVYRELLIMFVPVGWRPGRSLGDSSEAICRRERRKEESSGGSGMCWTSPPVFRLLDHIVLDHIVR